MIEAWHAWWAARLASKAERLEAELHYTNDWDWDEREVLEERIKVSRQKARMHQRKATPNQ